LQNIPKKWNVDIKNKEAALIQFLFTDEWFEDSWQTFLKFLQYFSS
jgi:hypothetical protein